MKMKMRFIYLLILLSVIINCYFDDCFDVLLSRSPEQLFAENEFVSLCELVNVDTLTNLGTYKHYGSSTEFIIYEYTFKPIKLFKAKAPVTTIDLWVCERVDNDGYTTKLKSNIGDNLLVYGNQLQTADSLFYVLAPNCRIEQLVLILQGKPVKIRYVGDRVADSTIAEDLLQNDSLIAAYKNAQANSKYILYCKELFMRTLKSFTESNIPFYDNDDKCQKLTSHEYLKRLEELSSSK